MIQTRPVTINIFAGEGKFGALYEKIISQNRECSYFYLFIFFFPGPVF